jgi:hypothetical protein
VDIRVKADKIPPLFRNLLNRDVTAAKIAPFTISVSDPCVTATYLGDGGALIAVCVCDIELVANAGAALVLIPAPVAKDSVRSRKIDEGLAENFQEILNICASIVSSSDNHRTSLGKVFLTQAARTPEVTQFIKASRTQSAVKLSITGYEAGRMCIYT